MSTVSSGNALYLVCAPCSDANEKDFGFKLAERGVIGAYQVFGPKIASAQLGIWLSKHRHCGSKNLPDHFKLGHLNTPNEDQPKRPILSLKRVNGTEIVPPVNQSVTDKVL